MAEATGDRGGGTQFHRVHQTDGGKPLPRAGGCHFCFCGGNERNTSGFPEVLFVALEQLRTVKVDVFCGACKQVMRDAVSSPRADSHVAMTVFVCSDTSGGAACLLHSYILSSLLDVVGREEGLPRVRARLLADIHRCFRCTEPHHKESGEHSTS